MSIEYTHKDKTDTSVLWFTVSLKKTFDVSKDNNI